MSNTQGRGGGGGGGGDGDGRRRKRDRLTSIANRFRSRPSTSGTPIRITSPNDPIAPEQQSGMIITARGPRGARIVILNNGTWNDALRASPPSNVQTNIARLYHSFTTSTEPEDDSKNGEQPCVGQIQIVLYQTGVGNETEGNIVMRNLANIVAGGLGRGKGHPTRYEFSCLTTNRDLKEHCLFLR